MPTSALSKPVKPTLAVTVCSIRAAVGAGAVGAKPAGDAVGARVGSVSQLGVGVGGAVGAVGAGGAVGARTGAALGSSDGEAVAAMSR